MFSGFCFRFAMNIPSSGARDENFCRGVSNVFEELNNVSAYHISALRTGADHGSPSRTTKDVSDAVDENAVQSWTHRCVHTVGMRQQRLGQVFSPSLRTGATWCATHQTSQLFYKCMLALFVTNCKNEHVHMAQKTHTFKHKKCMFSVFCFRVEKN